MAGGFDVRIQNLDAIMRRMSALISGLGEASSSKVLDRAMARTMNSIKTEVTRIARQAYTAHPKKMFSQTSVSYRGGTGILRVKGNMGLSLYHFKPSPKLPRRGKRGRGADPAGVTVQVKRGGGRHLAVGPSGYSKSFIMGKRQGGFGIFVRKQGASKNALLMLHGPSPIQAIRRKEEEDRINQKASEVFEKRITHEIDRILGGH